MLEKQIKVIEKFIQVHGDLYDYALVEYKNTKKKVKIICKAHGEFFQSPEKHIYRKQGCPLCGKLKNQESNTYSQKDIIEKFRKVHQDRYDYSLVEYKNIHSKVQLICSVHGSFWQSANSHVRGNGCPSCANENRKNTLKDFLEKLPLRVKETYDFSLVNYSNNITPVKVVCKEHGIFEIIPRSLFRGHGCKKCACVKVAENNRSNYEDMLQKANTIHNNRFKYSPIENYKTNKDLWVIECPVHGIFEQQVVSHLRGHGCIKCSQGSSSSKDEKDLACFIEQLGYKVLKNYRPEWLNGLEIDIYLPDKKVAIEYNGGIYHHSSKSSSIGFYKNTAKSESYHRDKYELCKQNQVDLIHVFDFENLTVWKQTIKLYLENKNNYEVVYNHTIRTYSPRKNVELVMYGMTQLVKIN